MTTRTAAPDLPDTGAATAADLAVRVGQIRTAIASLRRELESHKKAPRIGLSNDQLRELALQKGLLLEQLEQRGQELSAAEGELKRAEVRKAEESAAADAAAAPERVATALAAVEAADSALKKAASELRTVVSRLFDRDVRALLAVDPTAGLRGRILRLAPNSQLEELERDGRSLVVVRQQWPKLSIKADGGSAEFLDLHLIATPADYEAWLAQGHHPIPANSKANRQLGELASKFGHRFF
ncbi:MAG: hypothetical protein ACREOQ_06285 [Gemmatimonadales bacterium]